MVSRIHHCMPLILARADLDHWLGTADLLRSIRQRTGSRRNGLPTALAPVSSRHFSQGLVCYKPDGSPRRFCPRRLTILIAIVRQSAGSRYRLPSVRDSIAPGTCAHIFSAMTWIFRSLSIAASNTSASLNPNRFAEIRHEEAAVGGR